jgi:hypothetical protein
LHFREDDEPAETPTLTTNARTSSLCGCGEFTPHRLASAASPFPAFQAGLDQSADRFVEALFALFAKKTIGSL